MDRTSSSWPPTMSWRGRRHQPNSPAARCRPARRPRPRAVRSPSTPPSSTPPRPGSRIRSAGDTDVGGITNAAGDIDILARNNINSLTSGGGNMAGVDIALDGGTVTVGALTAGDDVAVRAAQFSATSIASGQSVAGQAPVDTIGAADRLIASAGAFTLAGVYYDLTGHDIDIIAPAGIAVTGPITAAPATSGFLSSDVRLEALDGVSVANITADRDILVIAGLRAGSVTGGAFTAGRDVAVWVHPGAGSIALASAEAGDDIVLRSPTAITVTGGLTTQGLDVSPAVGERRTMSSP